MSSMYVSSVHKQQQDYNVFTTVLNQKEGIIDLHTDKDSIKYYLKDLKLELNFLHIKPAIFGLSDSTSFLLTP